jgi:LysM repeat protein
MRLRSALLAAAALFSAGACFGGADQAPQLTPTPIPTATPFATIPAPAIVTPATAPATAPDAETDEQIYTVVAGDSISVIADRFDVTSAAIRALNNLTGNDIIIGQKLRIPAKAPASSAGTSTTPPALPDAGGVTTYTVKAGDSAFGIALQFDTSVEALEAANGVEPGGLNNLQIGQVVKLPPPGSR